MTDAGRRRDFVLDSFSPEEMEEMRNVVAMAVAAVKLAVSRGIRKAMNDFNGIDSRIFVEKELERRKKAEAPGKAVRPTPNAERPTPMEN
jgi:hypothetical protein